MFNSTQYDNNYEIKAENLPNKSLKV